MPITSYEQYKNYTIQSYIDDNSKYPWIPPGVDYDVGIKWHRRFIKELRTLRARRRRKTTKKKPAKRKR